MLSLSALKNFLRGLLMGAAEVVPGVSGGTVALIVGVYERLLAAINRATTAVLRLLKADLSGMLKALQAIDWGLLLPLGAGMVAVIFIGARFIPYILETYPAQSNGLFFGLIAGSIIIPWHCISNAGWQAVVLAGSAAVVTFLLVGLPPAREIADPSLIYVFLVASVAICALILPGVSGAYFLLVFGIYHTSLKALIGLEEWYVATFLAGAAFGLAVFARLLNALLRSYYDVTMAVLVGLMAGSLRALWPYLADDRSLLLPQAGDPIAVVVMLALGGAAFVLGLHAWSRSRRPLQPADASS